MKQILWSIQAGAFYIFTWCAAIIPNRHIPRIGRWIGFLMSRFIPKRRKIAIDNIRQAMPYMKKSPFWNCTLESAEEIADETFAHLGMSLMETCKLYHGRGKEILDNIEIRGREHYEKARAKNKGLVFITGHCGNWELIALAFKHYFDDNMSVIARRQNNPYLNSMVAKMRMRYDNQIIYKQGAMKPIISVLRKKGVIGILTDQTVFEDEGVLINVLGRKAWATKAAVVIGQKTGVPLVPAYIHREGDRHVITISAEHELINEQSETALHQNVQSLSNYLEDFVCAHPTDWYWVHRRWKRAGEPAE